jgi:hypothetical protein
MTTKKFFTSENLEMESRAIELGIKREMTFNDLSEDDKLDFFFKDEDFTLEDALEMTR